MIFVIKETYPVFFTIEKYWNTYFDLVEAKKKNSLVLLFLKATFSKSKISRKISIRKSFEQ